MAQAKFELKWNLDDLVTLDRFDALLAEVEHSIGGFADWFAKFTPDMTTQVFQDYIAWSEAVGDKMARAGGRAELMETLDASDEQAKQLKGRVKDLAQRLSEAGRKIELWLKGLPVEGKQRLDDANAARLFASVPDLEYALHHAREAAKHTLSEGEENIVMAKDLNGVSVLVDLRDLLVSEQSFTLRAPGKKAVTFDNEEQLKALVYSTDQNLREAAYHALYEVYKRNATRYFMIYQATVKDWDYEASLRGYASPIAMRNFSNHVPDRAIEVLMDVCERNVKVFQDYFRFKARELGLPKLRRFDIYAPLAESTQRFPLDQAVDMVLTTYSEFSPAFADKAERIIDSRHVDSAPTKTKHGGAFCATITPKVAPYVLLNYTDSVRDVSTLAHELGHGIHSLYADRLPASVQHATLPLAETASTFGEMVLFEKLLDQASDDTQRKIMLADKMADSYASICRQNFFVKAELQFHERMSQGLTPTDMNKIWLETLTEQFGDSVEVDPMFGYEWAMIPHIVHTPFYCYAYNFGELLSLALFARYKKEGQGFVASIEKILSSGGSRDPQLVLRELGIDMTEPKFWQGSFTILQQWMDRLQNLAVK